MTAKRIAFSIAALSLASAAFAGTDAQQGQVKHDQTQAAQTQQDQTSRGAPSNSAVQTGAAGSSTAQSGMAAQSSAASGQNSIERNDQVVRDVQQNLNQNGEHVAVDGQWGPQTQRAVRDFQQSKGIQANGQLNHQTLQALGVQASNQ